MQILIYKRKRVNFTCLALKQKIGILATKHTEDLINNEIEILFLQKLTLEDFLNK